MLRNDLQARFKWTAKRRQATLLRHSRLSVAMKCQQCEKPATFHITELTGGQPQELHLCEGCAKTRRGTPHATGPDGEYPNAMHFCFLCVGVPAERQLGRYPEGDL